jgi:hypothetical protein
MLGWIFTLSYHLLSPWKRPDQRGLSALVSPFRQCGVYSQPSLTRIDEKRAARRHVDGFASGATIFTAETAQPATPHASSGGSYRNYLRAGFATATGDPEPV